MRIRINEFASSLFDFNLEIEDPNSIFRIEFHFENQAIMLQYHSGIIEGIIIPYIEHNCNIDFHFHLYSGGVKSLFVIG
jgi:hypothetical protein